MSGISDKFLQFPLCGLAFSSAEKERLDQIISFGFVDAGFVMFQKLDPDIRRMKAKELSDHSDTPRDFSKANNDHVAAMLGAREIGITVGSLRYSIERWRKFSDLKNQFEAKHGRDVEVRVRRDLAFEARDNTGISYREFAVLCAVYSCIGAKKYPVRITRQTIQCRMLGYKSSSIMAQELANRADGLKPLTLRQVNYVLDRLDERRFFARARANKRQTFYSIRLTQDQLENRLVEGKSYRDSFHERRVKRDVELMARVKARRAAIKVNTAIKVDNEHQKSTTDVHSASATVSTEAFTGLSTLIKTPKIETLSTETSSIQTRENTAGALNLSQKAAEEKRNYQSPSLEEVREFAQSLHREVTLEQAARWFELHGADLQWTQRDWRKPCATWILDTLRKIKRTNEA